MWQCVQCYCGWVSVSACQESTVQAQWSRLAELTTEIVIDIGNNFLVIGTGIINKVVRRMYGWHCGNEDCLGTYL